MRKKQLIRFTLFYLQFSVIFFTQSFAQITITSSDLPVAGENWTYFNNQDSVFTTFIIDLSHLLFL